MLIHPKMGYSRNKNHTLEEAFDSSILYHYTHSVRQYCSGNSDKSIIRVLGLMCSDEELGFR